MPTWLKLTFIVIVLAVATLIVYNILKTYVFSKIKINKWIILTLGILILILPYILHPFKINLSSGLWNYVLPVIVGIIFLWFLDSLGFSPNSSNNNSPSKKDFNNNVVIKPKAKPNRVKYLKKDENEDTHNKKNTKI